MTSWVESRLLAILCFCCAYARFPSALIYPFHFFREDLDAKAAFVTLLGKGMQIMQGVDREVLGRRSRIPVSCAGFLVFIRPLFARVREVTSAKGSLVSTSLHFFSHKHLVSPWLTVWVYSHKAKVHVRSARIWSGPRESRTCLDLRELRRRLAEPSRIFRRPRTRMWLWLLAYASLWFA